MKPPSSDTATLPEPSATTAAAAPGLLVPVWRDYLMLTKPEITFLVTLSALAGYLFGTPGAADPFVLVALLVGVGLSSAGACGLNHYLERHLDGQMKRTASRPLPAGRITPEAARAFGVLLVLAGVGLLCPLVNPLTGILAILTVVMYLYVYTPLKRKTKYNTLTGTLPGALPALGGYAAATNTLGAGGWTIFAILVLWQMPHFLSLAWMYRKDYGRAQYAMLPVVEPDGRSTAFQTLLFTVLLLLASLTPTLVGVAGGVYLVAAMVLGLWFIRPAWVFYRTRTVQDARRVLKASIVYIPALVAFIVVDWLLR